MANENKIISKLTKGFKLKINKKKKSTWKTLNSTDSLSPSDEYMLCSDTEAELYQAKANIEANRSFSESQQPQDTSNVLFIGRSKTYNIKSTNPFANLTTQPMTQTGKYLFQNNDTSDSRKNSFQTLYVKSPQMNASSNPNSPLSVDSSDTIVNDIKISATNPFKISLTASAPATPAMKSTTISTSNTRKMTSPAMKSVSISLSSSTQNNNNLLPVKTPSDPALSHTLISPIEFDVAGKEIKNTPKTNETSTTTTTTTTTTTKNETPIRSKSVKRIKPLITFDIPPVVSPMTADSDSDDYIRGRKRSTKKSKKYSKKHNNVLNIKTTDLKNMSRLREGSLPPLSDRKSAATEDRIYSEPTSAIVARANSRLHSPYAISNEEDDDVPLGIIQYKCLSSLLKDTNMPTISSVQTKTYTKSSYGYISPPPTEEKYDLPKFSNYSKYYQKNYVM